VISGKTTVVAHLGYPTFAFKAPMIYNPWFDKKGIDAVVVPMGVPAADYPGVLASLGRLTNLHGALVTMPIAALASFLVLAASPVLLVLAAGQILRRGGEYGIAKPSREVLFTIVDAETKYKAKNFIDTVLQRGSDLIGIGLVTLAHAAGLGLVGYAWIGVALMVPAIFVSLGLGKAFERIRAGTS